MKIFRKISAFITFYVLFCMVNAFAAGNPVDSDLSNTAGSNSGKSHLDIYLFIVALLVLCIIVPFFEKKNKKNSTRQA